MNLAAFRIQFPEFRSAADEYVQAYLDAAAVQLSETYWRTYYDQAHGYQAANLLAMAPNGQNARLDPTKTKTTTYAERLQRLREEITFGDRLI